MTVCASPAGRTQRVFWTTQPDACGSTPDCTSNCGRPGLVLTSSSCGASQCQCCPPPTENINCLPQAGHERVPRSFVTTDWVRSLAINILMTDGAKPRTSCGYRPGAQGGHWSESFRRDGQKSGSQIRYLGKSSSIRDSIALAKATLTADLAKLVVMKIAREVRVDTVYSGGNNVVANIEIIAPDGTNVKVGMSGTRNANSWAWS